MTMTREEAIKELYAWLDGCCGDEEIEPAREAFRMAIEALMAQDVTDTNVGDMVYRQAAIDLIDGIETERLKGNIELIYAPAIKGLRALPSVQPEIIRCKDCKWWERINDTIGYCHATKHCHYSSNWEISIYRRQRPDFYCADAERRTDV